MYVYRRLITDNVNLRGGLAQKKDAELETMQRRRN